MAEHIHNVYDTDLRFTIDPVTRAIKNGSGKAVVVQHDHNSERVTFDLPKMIDGHDMTKCNVVEVQYINIDATTKEKAVGVYAVTDLAASGVDRATCSWLISCNATGFAGKLAFMLRFKCVGGDGKVSYAWNTDSFGELTVLPGMDNGEAVVAEYADILDAWWAKLTKLEEAALPEVTVEDTYKILRVRMNGEGYEVIPLHEDAYMKTYVLPFMPPPVTEADNDKILQVVDGAWAAVEIATWGGGDF